MGKLPDVITKVMRNYAKRHLLIFLNHLTVDYYNLLLMLGTWRCEYCCWNFCMKNVTGVIQVLSNILHVKLDLSRNLVSTFLCLQRKKALNSHHCVQFAHNNLYSDVITDCKLIQYFTIHFYLNSWGFPFLSEIHWHSVFIL